MLFIVAHSLICLLLALILGALLAFFLRSLMNAFASRSDLESLAHKWGDTSTFALKSDLPDLSGFALKSELPDLSGVMKSAELPAKVALIGYALKSELPAMPDLSGFAKKSELPAMPDLSGFAKKSELPAMPDLSGFAKKTDIPASPDLSAFVKKSELPALADLAPYALKSEIPVIPDLSRFAEKSALPVIPDLSSFALKSEIPAIPEMGEFARKSDLPEISSLANISDIEQWKKALNERDDTIASLQRSLAEEAAKRASEISRLEAMMQGRMKAAEPVTAPVAKTAPPAAPVATGKPDNLKRIWGVGPVLEKRLHDLGVTTFLQIAHWSDADIARIEPQLDTIPDRIQREDWVRQCSTLLFGPPPETSAS